MFITSVTNVTNNSNNDALRSVGSLVLKQTDYMSI